jgi:hypothetical protein
MSQSHKGSFGRLKGDTNGAIQGSSDAGMQCNAFSKIHLIPSIEFIIVKLKISLSIPRLFFSSSLHVIMAE